MSGTFLLNGTRRGMTEKIKILFVCMGNICRSPMAEGIFRYYVEEKKLLDKVHIDSAGTHDYHVGSSPDKRAQAIAAQRGVDLSKLAGRQVANDDFAEFDHILVMDRLNHKNLLARCPTEYQEKIQLLLEYAPNRPEQEVPDPYYGNIHGFERVLDMLEEAAGNLLTSLRDKYKL